MPPPPSRSTAGEAPELAPQAPPVAAGGHQNGTGTGNGSRFTGQRVIHLELSLRGLTVIGGVLLAGYVLLQLWPVLILLAFALIFMAALLPMMTALVTRGVPRTLAMLVTVFTPLLVIVALVPLVVPSLLDEFSSIDRDLPRYAGEMDMFLGEWGVDLDLERRIREVDLRRYSSGRIDLVSTPVLLGAFSALTVIVLTAYLLMDLPRLSRFMYGFVPRGKEAEFEELMTSLRRVVGGYVRGQAITSAAITLFTLVVLLAVGAPNPLAFAVLAGIADIIPLVGGFLAVVPAVIATLDVSVERALIVLASLVLYQQFEDRVLLPRVYGSTMHLPPLVVFLVVIAGAQLLGVIGVLLALPAVAAARVLVEYSSRHRDIVPLKVAPRSELFAPEAKTEE